MMLYWPAYRVTTVDVHSTAAVVTIPRPRQFVLNDGDRHYQVMIKLPKDYRNNRTHHYPVVYMTDSMYSLQVVSGATLFPMNSNIMQQAMLVAIGYQRPSDTLHLSAMLLCPLLKKTIGSTHNKTPLWVIR
jgi:hypothetical protein